MGGDAALCPPPLPTVPTPMIRRSDFLEKDDDRCVLVFVIHHVNSAQWDGSNGGRSVCLTSEREQRAMRVLSWFSGQI